jgi:acyl carrier protein
VAIVLTEIQTLLQQRFGLSCDEVAPEHTLDSVGIDSLTAVELMFELEDKFGISLAEERADVKTIADVASVVERALRGKESAV